MRAMTLPRQVLWSLLLMLPAITHAGFVIEGSGTGTSGESIDARAEFDFVSHDFGAGSVDAIQITLTNLSEVTSFRGNLLTSFFWSLADDPVSGNPVGNLSTTSSGFDGLAATVQTTVGGSTTTNVDIAPAVNNTTTDGTWQLSNGPFGTANSGDSYSAYDYGIATVGMGLTGFSGAAVNGDDYGIFASGSDLTQDGLPQTVPVIDTSAVFWILRPSEFTSYSQIIAARFGFGSLPDNYIIASIPEPMTLSLFSIGIAGLWLSSSRRKKVSYTRV